MAKLKIICTTDPKLTIWKQCEDCKSIGNHVGCNLCKKINIPQVQQSFLKEFVKNPAGEWEVECEALCTQTGKPCGMPCMNEEVCNENITLKLNQDNEATITSVESNLNEAQAFLLKNYQLSMKLKAFTPGLVADIMMQFKDITSVEEKMYSREEYEAKIKSITLKEIHEAKSIQHTFRHDTFGESLLYILNRLD